MLEILQLEPIPIHISHSACPVSMQYKMPPNRIDCLHFPGGPFSAFCVKTSRQLQVPQDVAFQHFHLVCHCSSQRLNCTSEVLLILVSMHTLYTALIVSVDTNVSFIERHCGATQTCFDSGIICYFDT